MIRVKKPVSEVEIGTPIIWVCECARGMRPMILTASHKYIGENFGSVCEVEVLTEEEFVELTGKNLN